LGEYSTLTILERAKNKIGVQKMNKKNLFKALTTSAFVAMAFLTTGTANAMAVSGNFGASGYDVINFSVATPGTVDLQYTGGYSDPTFSLFNGSGAHLITNDEDLDKNSLYPHITQTLGAGNYSLLVSYCCANANYVGSEGSSTSLWDGYNNGSYSIGGTGTLSGMQAYLDLHYFDESSFYAAGSSYSLTVSDNVQVGAVPVPAAAWLLGSGLLGLVGVARRKAA
jgi:hypothetical protein